MSTHNGWTNYETWRVNLELFDGSDDCWTAESARAFAEEMIECSTQEGLGRDYAMAFLSSVNWHEIAAHYASNESEVQHA